MKEIVKGKEKRKMPVLETSCCDLSLILSLRTFLFLPLVLLHSAKTARSINLSSPYIWLKNRSIIPSYLRLT